jgi:hypothetical protein
MCGIFHRGISGVADQTKIDDRNRAPESASKGFARGVGDFTHDVLTLAELQAQLLAADVRECRQHALAPAILLVSGLVVGLACFPVGLAALALYMVESYKMSYATGFLTASIAGAVLGALLSVFGCLQVRKSLAVLRRSQHELIRNLRWIRKVVDHSRTK